MKRSNIWLSVDGIEPSQHNTKKRKKRKQQQRKPIDYTCSEAYNYSGFRYTHQSIEEVLVCR